MEAMRNMGFILRQMGLLDDALECYDRILAKEEDPSDLRSKAAVLVGLGRMEEALECLMVSADIAPSPQVEQEISMLRMMLMGSLEKKQQ
jgi:tetratricopeptide (TPR) repeat protein